MKDSDQNLARNAGKQPKRPPRGTPDANASDDAGESGIGRPRKGLQDRVYAQLKRGLMIGAFVPGQTITLRKLAETLGTSPMPVREAIAQLVTINALEILPNGSVAVPKLTKERFSELSMVRQMLEGMAAAEATAYATPQLISQLEQINKDLLKAIKAREILGCLSKNQEFHFALYMAYPSEVLLPVIETLWLQAGPMMYFSLAAPDTNWDASLHVLIIDALVKKDAATVKKLIEKDISTTARHLLKCSAFRGDSGPIAELRLMP